MERELRASLEAGALGGFVTLAGFFVIHALAIRLIWNVWLEGVVPTFLGGLAAGWAYHELVVSRNREERSRDAQIREARSRAARGREAGSREPSRPLLRGALLGAQLWFPIPIIGALVRVLGEQPATLASAPLIVAFVSLGLLAAAGLAWWQTRDRRATKAGVVASLLPVFVFGGDLVLVSPTGHDRLLILGMLPVLVLSGVVLAGARPRFAARLGARVRAEGRAQG